MMDIYLFLVLAILPLLYLYLRNRKTLDFPGPPQLPIIGNLHKLNMKKLHVDFAEWARQHGAIYKLNFVGRESLVVNDIKYFHELMVTRGMEFAGRPTNHEADIFSDFGKDILLGQPTKEWKAQRKYGHTTMKMYDRGQDKIENISMEVINSMVDELMTKNGEEVSPLEYMYFVTTNVISTLLVGRSYSKDSQYYKLFLEFEDAFEKLTHVRPKGALMDAMPFLKGRYDLCQKELDRTTVAMKEIAEYAKREARKSEEEGYNESLITNVRNAVEKGEITEVHMDQMITDMIIAGSLTTTYSMLVYLNLMIHHPEIQRKLQSEIDDVIGERSVTLKDRATMPYNMACLYEVLRYLTPVPLGIFHIPVQDTTIDGKHVPAGTQIFFNHFTVNHDPEKFPEPFTFNPDRFIDSEGKLVAADHPNRRNMNVFGWGPRICLGEPLAKGRLFLLMVTLLQKFNVKPGASGYVTCDVREFNVAAVLRQPEYKCSFVPRA